jgi:WD40 repeat protein
MGRFLLTLVVGLALFLGVAYYFDLFVPTPEDRANPLNDPAKREAELGGILYPGKPLPQEPPYAPNPKYAESIVVPAHWVAMDKSEVGCLVDGQIRFVGEPIPDALIALAGVAPFAADPFLSTRVAQGGSDDLVIFYRRLGDGATVDADQIIGLLDPAKAMIDVAIKQAKIVAADQEYKGAHKTYQEAEERFRTARRLYERNPPVIGLEEYREKLLARDKFETEAEAKKAAIDVAKKELEAAEVTLKHHYIRNPIDRGLIKTIYHNRGNQVKNQEPILSMYSTSRLQAEGLVEAQHWDRLHEKMPVIVEPIYEEDPIHTFRGGHQAEVNGVAVSKDSRLFISVSEDRKACVWVNEMSVPKWEYKHPDPVRSVACTPPSSKQNLCLTGCANGSIYLWDLDHPEKPPSKLPVDAHRDPVTALAFSPDGTYFASGGEDNLIFVWKTGEEKPLYKIDDHPPSGKVTSLAFTPQARLVSASNDNTLRVWELHEKGAKVVGEAIGGRSGRINQLGVSQDGRFMLFDQGKTLQLLSVTDGRIFCKPLEAAGGASFETLALLSPDGSLMLTAGAAEGRLQIWKTPTAYTRGYELRQLVSDDKPAVTCAAFAPDAGLAATGPASCAISGSKDGTVYLWSVPDRQAVSNHRITDARLTMVSQAAESGTRQVRVGVEVLNPDRRLRDGRPATIVIEQ